MKRSPLQSADRRAIEDILEMGGGYVLDFTNRTFSEFFSDLGVDIDRDYPDGSKADRLRVFLRHADASRLAQTLQALLDYRGARDGEDPSPNVAKVKALIRRLRNQQGSIGPAAASSAILELRYVHELGEKIEQRLEAQDLEGAITASRTLLEAVLAALESELTGSPGDYKGDLQKQFRGVAKQLRIDEERADLDENFKQVARGLVQIVNGLAPIRNKMSDGHARERKPLPHHARFMANAAKTVTSFLIESYHAQQERKLIPASPKQLAARSRGG